MIEELSQAALLSLSEGPLETLAASQTISDSKAIYQLSTPTPWKKINMSQVDSLISLKTPGFNDVLLAQHLLSKSHYTLSAAF